MANLKFALHYFDNAIANLRLAIAFSYILLQTAKLVFVFVLVCIGLEFDEYVSSKHLSDSILLYIYFKFISRLLRNCLQAALCTKGSHVVSHLGLFLLIDTQL